MGVVTVSSSVSRTPLGLSASFSSYGSSSKRLVIVAFKTKKTNTTTLVVPQKPALIPVEKPKDNKKRRRGSRKSSERLKAVSIDEALPCTLEVDYNEAAAKLENIYILSPTIDVEDTDHAVGKGRCRRGKTGEVEENSEKKFGNNVVRSWRMKPKRLSLEMRIALRNSTTDEMVSPIQMRKHPETEEERTKKLVKEYSVTSDLTSLDWKKMTIPAVLPSSEHAWLFKLMQPMKALSQVKENLQRDLGREVKDSELGEATKMSAVQVRKCLEVGRAARSKLIKHNLRLVLFVINKYFQEFANGNDFQDFCQAGVRGLITAIDRFEPNKKFRLSTYSLFWIRHAIIRSMTLSSFTRVPFGLESVRVGIQRANLELSFELQRLPTEKEISEKIGISPERYHDVMRASKPVASLHARNSITQEEFIDGITDSDSVGCDNRRQPALLRLALDDVLDSLKPKESLVIRQRYGLDGKGDRTLGEIAGNLNISREMVRKYEVKALMKLRNPARVDYLRRYVF